jgi:hypothetical protein
MSTELARRLGHCEPYSARMDLTIATDGSTLATRTGATIRASAVNARGLPFRLRRREYEAGMVENTLPPSGTEITEDEGVILYVCG